MQKGGRAEVGSRSRDRLILAAVVAAVLLVDQLSKAWALEALAEGRRIALLGDLFGLQLVRNPGGAFGFLPGSTIVLTVASMVLVVFVGVTAWRKGEVPGLYGLILGGGIGNLIDRFARPPHGGKGWVIDFLQSSVWPTFNVADSAIVIGVVLIVVGSFRHRAA